MKCKTVFFFSSYRKKSLQGIKRKQAEAEEDSEVEDPGVQDDRPVVESDDEVEYYRQAVGEEPDEDMFPAAKRRPRKPENTHSPFKKKKFSPSQDRDGKSPKRKGAGGQHGGKPDKMHQKKGWKKPRDGEKPFGKTSKPAGKAFGAKKYGDRDNKFSGRKKFDGNKDKSFKSKGQKGKLGFKKGSGAKQGFKQRKGKG